MSRVSIERKKYTVRVYSNGQHGYYTFVSGKMQCLLEGGYHSRVATIRGKVLSACEEHGMLRQMDKGFCFDSTVCRHHVYKTVQTPFLGGDPDC